MAVTHFHSPSSVSSTYFALEWWFAYITFKTISKETREMNKSLLGAEKATEAAGESCQWEDFTLLLIKWTKAKAALGCTLLLRPQLQSFQFSSMWGPSRQRSCSPTHSVKRLSAAVCVLSPPPATPGLYYFTFWLKWCHLQIKAQPGTVIESQVVYGSDLQQACTCLNIRRIKGPPCPTQYWLDPATKSHPTRVKGLELGCRETGRDEEMWREAVCQIFLVWLKFQ